MIVKTCFNATKLDNYFILKNNKYKCQLNAYYFEIYNLLDTSFCFNRVYDIYSYLKNGFEKKEDYQELKYSDLIKFLSNLEQQSFIIFNFDPQFKKNESLRAYLKILEQ